MLLSRRAELLLPAGAAGVLTALLVWLGPPGADFAAHAYQRALYVQHGFVLWNNFWYAGRYSFITYSVLYYPLAAALGIRALAVLIVAVSVAAFAAVVRHEWGEHSRWPIRAFAVVWAVLVVSAAYPFMLGSALALLALLSLQHGRRWVFAAFALFTLAASPLAFLLLVVLLAGVALARRAEAASYVVPALATAAIGALELVLQRMFPEHGRYPFAWDEFAAVSVFCILGVALTWGVPGARLIPWTLTAYFVACTATFAISSPVGANIDRLRFAAIPIAMLILSLRAWRPRLLCVAALALAVSWNLTPLAASFIRDVADPAANAAYWKPAIAYLRDHVPPSYRTEAVDTSGHWPAYFLARAGIPLVRGWYRQEDFPQNALLYGRLGPTTYVDWLRKMGVRYVVLTAAPPDYSARAEARLLESGRSGLKLVFHTPTAKVFAVPSPQPLISAPARMLQLGYTTIRLDVPRAGDYRLAVNYAPYWQTQSGCLRPTKDGMTELTVTRPGIVSLRFDVTASRAFDAIVGEQPGSCR